MTRVLLAVDESDDSVRAAEAARRLFGQDAEFLAVNVAAYDVAWTYGYGYGYVWPYWAMPPVSTAVTPAPASITAERGQTDRDAGNSPGGDNTAFGGLTHETTAEADPTTSRREEAADTADRMAHAAGIPDAEAIGELGDPATAVLAAAHSHAADVIVVGSHDKGWFSRLFGGSVSRDLMRESDVPVLVVK